MCKIAHWLKCHISQTFHNFLFIWVIKIIHPTPNECFQPWEPFMHGGSCLKDYWTHFRHNKLLWEVSQSSRFFSAALHAWSTPKLWPSTRPCPHLDRKGSHVRMLFIHFSSALNCIIPSTLKSRSSETGPLILLCGLDRPRGSSTGPPRDVFTRHANWKSAHRSDADVKLANGAASVVITNDERAHWESKTLTSWFRTTQPPSSDN